MDKFSQSIVSKINSLQKRIESVLDSDFEAKVEATERLAQFEASRDLALVRGLSLGLPDDHVDRTIVVFSRAAMLFEAGVLLENYDGNWKPQAYFHKGATSLIKNNTKTLIQIPQMNLFSVLSTNAQTILEKIQLQKLDPDQRSSCLLIKVSPDFAFLFLSNLADLWLKEHVENVRRALINGMAD